MRDSYAFDGAALAHGLFLHHLRLVDGAAVVVDTVADDGAGDRARRGGGNTAGAAADLVTEQGAGEAADDRAAGAALLLLLDRRLHVLGAAFLARHANLLDARLNAHDAAEIFEFDGVHQWQGGQAECGNHQFGLHVHFEPRYVWGRGSG